MDARIRGIKIEIATNELWDKTNKNSTKLKANIHKRYLFLEQHSGEKNYAKFEDTLYISLHSLWLYEINVNWGSKSFNLASFRTQTWPAQN